MYMKNGSVYMIDKAYRAFFKSWGHDQTIIKYVLYTHHLSKGQGDYTTAMNEQHHRMLSQI